MNYLVLGSAGQIGSALVSYLERQGHEVLGFDIVDSPDEDLRSADNALLIDRLRRADFVMFLAFDVGGSRYLREYQRTFDFISNNARIMENTFSMLRRFKTPFIFISTQMSNMTYSPYGSLKVVGDIDTERLIQERMRSSSFGDSIGDMRQRLREFRHVEFAFEVPAGAIPLTRTVERFPYVPSEAMACDELCYEAYNIQVHGLTKRLKATGIERVVIGVSGGLDSTHALIVCAKTMDLLGHSRKNILAYTMPGFATSNRTKASAHRLMEALGVTAEELDIRPSCLQMMKDIGHPYGKGEQVFDVTFENVQAGERTSHLFRLANLHKALVVGTGDLSELALGWATYGVGDHMSHYNVNASVPKTLIQHLIRWVIRTSQLGPGAGVVLQTVLDTEISPELVPPIGDESQPAQSTQASIGPYELQDFNLYYTTRYGFRPSKIAFLALHAWADKDRGPWLSLIPDRRRNEYDLGTIVHWLEVFLYRFFKISQFKRSAMPNGPKVGCGGSLSPRGDWRAPSDSEAVVWLDEIHRSMAACQSGQESRDDKPKVAILNLLDHQASPGQVERIEVG